MQLENCRYIVVEGPIGAGTKALAKELADHLRAVTMLETPEANPFLTKFYRDKARYALATQLSFLLQRAELVAQVGQLDMFNTQTVADFMLEKDLLFAELTLSEEELRLYKSIYALYAHKVPHPDLVIYLQAPVEVLLQRVHLRANPYEQDISENYLRRLHDNYSRFFYQYGVAPLLTVNATHLNFVDSAEDFELLLQCIKQMRGGREFFNRA